MPHIESLANGLHWIFKCIKYCSWDCL